jgi:hypothetical protein
MMFKNRSNPGLAFLAAAAAASLAAGPAIAASKQGISGNVACNCMSGNTVVSGTCSFTVKDNGATCEKGAGDTCTATCAIVTFTHGATGGAALRGRVIDGTLLKGGATIAPE